jgi:hypothetical protein
LYLLFIIYYFGFEVSGLKLADANKIPIFKTCLNAIRFQLPGSIIHVLMYSLNLNPWTRLRQAQPSGSGQRLNVNLNLNLPSHPLDPTGLAALQIPRSTRRNFAQP